MNETELNRQRNRDIAGRDVCARCRRPTTGCYCAKIKPIKTTRTRLVLLQHPRERYVAIGTAHMASLCVEDSELYIGIDWSKSAPLARALSDPERTPILLYPGKDSIDITQNPPKGPVTLVVVDGTWSQTKKVVRTNPILAKLPRYAFVPPRPSEYRIRKEPNEASVSTIEALVHTLTALEGGGGGGGGGDGDNSASTFESMLAPFRSMIDFQIECETRFRGTQSRHTKRRARIRRLRVPRVLSDELENVVLVVAEANSWPYAMRRDPAYHDELVHWVAHRPATGETLSVFVAPRGEIAPGTTLHTGIDEATMRNAGSIDALHTQWRAFVRDTDVICSWGYYERNLFARYGGFMPARYLDLRGIARDVACGTVGSLAQYRATLVDAHKASAGSTALDDVLGRGGRKLRTMKEIVASFVLLVNQPASGEESDDGAGDDEDGSISGGGKSL